MRAARSVRGTGWLGASTWTPPEGEVVVEVPSSFPPVSIARLTSPAVVPPRRSDRVFSSAMACPPVRWGGAGGKAAHVAPTAPAAHTLRIDPLHHRAEE